MAMAICNLLATLSKDNSQVGGGAQQGGQGEGGVGGSHSLPHPHQIVQQRAAPMVMGLHGLGAKQMTPAGSSSQRAARPPPVVQGCARARVHGTHIGRHVICARTRTLMHAHARAQDYVYVAYFLICTSSFLKIRWWVAHAALLMPPHGEHC